MIDPWDDVFVGADGMRGYDDVLVPRLFTPWAEVLLDRVGVDSANLVLDVACGPGTVTRLASARVGPTGRVTGCDLSPAMLELARENGTPSEGGPIYWIECSADALQVDHHMYDVVVCQQGLQFFPDKVAALREMHRAARKGARVGIACWASLELSPMFAAMGRALRAHLGDDVADGFERGPWGLSDAGELGGLMEEAGFSSVRVEALSVPTVFEGGAAQMCEVLAFLPVSEPLRALDPRAQAEFKATVEAELAPITINGAVHADTVSNLAVATA